MKKVILTDIDGVTTKWQSGLPHFLSKNSIPTDTVLDMFINETFKQPSDIFGCNNELANMLINEYNNSSFIRYLSPYDDAVDVINRLKHEYDFVAITAIGSSNTASLNRIANLNALFPSAFKEVMVVEAGESKTQCYLQAKIKYGDRITCFIDDLAVNLEDCHNVMGHIPLFHMIRATRDECKSPNQIVSNWFDIEQKLKAKNITTIEESTLSEAYNGKLGLASVEII